MSPSGWPKIEAQQIINGVKVHLIMKVRDNAWKYLSSSSYIRYTVNSKWDDTDSDNNHNNIVIDGDDNDNVMTMIMMMEKKCCI